MQQRLWTRSEGRDHVDPVIVTLDPKREYLVGGSRTYKSARAMLADLTGHPQGRHWTFDRYFRLGRYESQRGTGPSIFEVFEIGSPAVIRSRVKGIDLEARGEEVAKLLFAGFGRRIHGCGYDPEDVLQEVMAGILVRNRGTCAFDSEKSSFGHYVHMVCECVLSNYHRKQSRRREKEQVGAFDKDGVLVDVADSTVADRESLNRTEDPLDRRASEDLERCLGRVRGVDAGVAIRILPLLQEGYGRAEMAERLGLSKAAISRALTCLRRVTREWIGQG